MFDNLWPNFTQNVQGRYKDDSVRFHLTLLSLHLLQIIDVRVFTEHAIRNGNEIMNLLRKQTNLLNK